MSINLRLPNITEPTADGKLRQIQSYLYQTVEQLNWALNTLESGGTGAVIMQGKNTAGSGSGGEDKKDNSVNFNELKALIIKSADIVNAYYEKISAKLVGKYVAQSDFGEYTEDTKLLIEANSNGIKQIFDNIQEIITDIDSLVRTTARIKSGLLDYEDDGTPIYGLEIGQRNEIDGVEVFHRYARFTADELSFYDSNGMKVAYISDNKLYIANIEITGSFSQGGFVDSVQSDLSVVTRWVGGEGQWR